MLLSDSVTRAPLPPWITWKLVTMWPRSSHMKPVPVPRGTWVASSENRPAARSSVVMCTTDGDTDLKTSMLLRSSAARSPRATTGRGATLAAGGAAARASVARW